PSSRGFERPYGWAWLLKLPAELIRHGGRPWAERMQALAPAFADRFTASLPNRAYPIRPGVHSSTAFAFALTRDYAEAADPELLALITERARSWYLGDRDAAAWEPSL